MAWKRPKALLKSFITDYWERLFPHQHPVTPPLLEELRVNERGRQLIILSEGYSRIPYICAAGVATIGYGCTISFDGELVTLDHEPIDRQLANKLFIRDLELFSKSVRALISTPINNNQFSALVSLAYNIGVGNFRASTLRRKLNRGDFLGASQEFKWWRRANGKILKGLVIRREKERLLFLS